MANSWRKPKLSQLRANTHKYLLQGKFTGKHKLSHLISAIRQLKSARLSIARKFCAGDNTSKQSPARKSKNKKCLLKCNEAANEYLSDKKTINAG